MVRVSLVELPRAIKSVITTVADFLGFALCASAAYWILLPGSVASANLLGSIGLFALFAVAVLWMSGFYRSVIRYVGLDLLRAAFGVSTITAVAGGVGALSLFDPALAARWALIFFAFALIYIVASRFLARLFLLNHRARKQREKVIIYGAGSAAAQLIPNLLSNDEFLPVALVDDDVNLHGTRISGIPVYSSESIEKLIAKMKAKRVLLALPSASRRKRRQVLERLSEHPVHVQTIPKVADIVNGKARVDDIRDVEVKDLLGRNTVPPDETLLNASVRDKTVLVTGAGGSIGSELCRQIIQLCPKRLILMDISEPSLYAVDRELQRYTVSWIAIARSFHYSDPCITNIA